MLNKLFRLFKSKNKPEDSIEETSSINFSNYMSPKDLRQNYEVLAKIPELVMPKNSKPNILLMDDNIGTVSFLKDDLESYHYLAQRIRTNNLSDMSVRLYNVYKDLTDKEINFLMNFDLSKYNIIEATGDMAGFSVENAIKNGAHFDIAVLDIILGGYKISKSENIIYDGIDIYKMLIESNPKIIIKFYTGCVLSKYSYESIKFDKIFGDDINNYAIIKDEDFKFRRKQLLKILIKSEKLINESN